MADSNEELIGAIGVSVTGDYSSLAASYSSAQDQAATAGEAIADAFNSGVAGVADAADIVTDSLSGIGPAADDAGGSLEGFAGAAGDACEAAETAGSRLTEMAEQMAAVGEALVITEGMRELGSEALTASDSITHAQIALTNLTGSGDTAKETIEALDQLGTSDGLAFPSLLQAGVRMQAILGPGADVVELLKGVADGAAVMGTDIETATTKFDQLATAGTASARTLTALGLSLGSLADAFNATQTGADATASSVAAMFKALDQQGRIDVLEAALSNLGGTAQQVAEQTFGGQWTQLVNEWEAIMVQVGQALLPVISDLTAFTKTDILPFLQELVADFNGLSEPAKDAVVGMTLITAALVPLTGAIAAVGLGLSGLASIAGVLGLSAVAAAPEVAGLATAATVAGTAAEVAGVAAGGLAAALAVPVASAAAAAGLGLLDLNTSLKSAQGTLHDVSDNDLKTFLSGIANLTQGTGEAGSASQQWEAKLATLKTALDNGVISAGQYATAVKSIETAQAALAQQNFEQSIAGWTSGLHLLNTAAQQVDLTQAQLLGVEQSIIQATTANTTGYNNAKQAYDAFNQSLQTGTPLLTGQVATAAQVADAYRNMQSAASLAGVTLGALPGSMDAITAAATNMANAGGVVVSAEQEQTNSTVIHTASLDLATKSYDASMIALDDYVSILNQAKAADDGSAASTANVTAAEKNVEGAYAASLKGLSDLNSTVQNYVSYMDGSKASTQAQIYLLQDLATKFGPATSAALGLDTQIAALQKQLNAPISGMPDALAGLQAALAETTANVTKFAGEMSQGMNVGVQYEKALTAQQNALIAVNVAQAETNTGLQGATDAYSLAVIAVAAAQAKYDTLNQAYQTNITLAPQVTAAAKALTDAHNALTTAAGNDKTATDALIDSQVKLYGAMGNLTTAAPGVVTGLNNIGTAAANATTQLNDVAAAVNGIEADMKSAFGSSSTQGGSFSTPAGEVYVGGLVTGAGEFGTESTAGAFYDTPAQSFKNALAAAQALMPAKGTSPTALAQDALAQAQAVLQVDTTYFGSGVGVTAQDLQTAQTAVTTAQAALAALEGGSSSGSLLYSGTYGSTPVGVTPIGSTGSVTTGASTTGSTTSATDSGTPITTSATGSGTGAIDGGSYPAVTAHQAAGETWFVTAGTSGGTPVAGGSTTITTDVANTISQTGDTSTGALSSISTAASGLVEQLATFTGDLLPISSSLASVASSVGQLVTAVSGGKINISVPGEVSSQAPATFAGTQTGSTAASGSITTIVGGGNPQGATSPITQAPPPTSIPGYNPFGPGSTVTPQVTINITGASNPNQMAAQVQTAVTAGIVAALRTAGARF